MVKHYIREFKDKLVLESLETGNIYMVAENYGIPPSTLYQWVNNYKRTGTVSLRNGTNETNDIFPKQYQKVTDQSLEKENWALKTLLGEKELEIQTLKELLKKANPHLYGNLK